MVRFPSLFAVVAQVGLSALSADEYIAQFPWQVSVGTPHVWPGMEKGQVACFDEGGLLQHVLVGAGLAPSVAEDPEGQIFDYFLEAGRVLKDIDPGSILNLMFPPLLLTLFGMKKMGQPMDDPSMPISAERRAENRELWKNIHSRALSKVRDHQMRVEQSGRMMMPIERNLQELKTIFEEAINDVFFGAGFRLMLQEYITADEAPEDADYEDFERQVRRLQEEEETDPEPGNIAPPDSDLLNLWAAYSTIHKKLLKTRAFSKLLTHMVSMERSDSLLTLWLRIFSDPSNLGKSVCGALDLALDEDDPEFAEGLRCGLQSAFMSMMACGGGPMQCTNPITRNYRDYAECNRPSRSDPTVTVAEQTIAPLFLLPREQVDGKIEDFQPNEAIMAEEAETYMYSWRGLQAGGQWTLNGTCKWDPSVNEDGYIHLIPGWRMTYDMWLRPEGTTTLKFGTTEAYPFAQLAQKVDDPCSLLIVNRGTSTEWEWFADLDAKMDTFPLDRHVEMDMKAHRGMQILMNSVWPGLRQYLQDNVLNVCAKVSVHITGHSLGGGMGMLWAIKLADFLEPFLRAPVNAVLFAPLRPMSVDTFEQAKQLPINLRSFVMELDLIMSMPCSGGRGMQLCNTRTAPGLAGRGTVEQYGDPWNEVHLSADYMVSLHFNNYYYLDHMFLYVTLAPELMAALSLPASLNAGASHNCANDCFTSVLGCSTKYEDWSGCDYTTVHPCDGSDAYLDQFPNYFLTQARCHTPNVTRACVP